MRIAAEEKRASDLARDVIVSSAAGVLWNIHVGEGNWVSPGETLAEFADCNQSFVEATLPERGFESDPAG